MTPRPPKRKPWGAGWVRTIIYISPELLERIRATAQEEQTSQADIVRRALRAYFAAHKGAQD